MEVWGVDDCWLPDRVYLIKPGGQQISVFVQNSPDRFPPFENPGHCSFRDRFDSVTVGLNPAFCRYPGKPAENVRFRFDKFEGTSIKVAKKVLDFLFKGLGSGKLLLIPKDGEFNPGDIERADHLKIPV